LKGKSGKGALSDIAVATGRNTSAPDIQIQVGSCWRLSMMADTKLQIYKSRFIQKYVLQKW